ncbi:hypothetical protein E1295_31860 [Nonomuraea mesophila]|uniref:Uncharacterized protein n=1 Tax=Nonomuraea mesophila TaxID=2530382 RepID=A0A4R5F066_9ACTN|nr:hypothetical protein [Nonomuraea mesophila]TDE40497.1 hypothetical protein E1295_31860 [Nonomuraea mesophila]
MQIDDPTEAKHRLEESLIALRMAQVRGDGDVAALTGAAEQARHAVDACYEEIRTTALEHDDLEALIGEHPPRAGTDDESWNDDTFPRALWIACAPADVMTADEWGAWLDGHTSDGERAAFFTAALKVNMRAPDGAIPKGWTQTPG